MAAEHASSKSSETPQDKGFPDSQENSEEDNSRSPTKTERKDIQVQSEELVSSSFPQPDQIRDKVTPDTDQELPSQDDDCSSTTTER